MSSKQKIVANRRNARRSTGPRTAAGKAFVRFNALTHGLTAQDAAFPSEDPAQFNAIVRAFEAEYSPASITELALVHQLADAQWRLRRAGRYETDLINLRDARLSERSLGRHHTRRPPFFSRYLRRGDHAGYRGPVHA